MQKKIAKAITETNFPQLFQKELNKARLDKVADKLDTLDDAVRIIKENEQNLKDLGTLKTRLDTLDKILVTVDKIAGGIQKYEQEQTLNSEKLSQHDDRIEKIETHLNLPLSP